MSRRQWIAAGAAVIVVGGGIAAASAIGSSASASSPSTTPKQTTTLVPVATRTLSTTQTVSGTVGYDSPTTVTLGAGAASASTTASTSSSAGSAKSAAGTSTATGSGATGTITALPAVGTVVPVGGSLAEVDGVPSAFLMVGSRPVWRAFTSGMTDGPDVPQLEESLAALGYGNYFTTDQTFTSGTASAINAFESAHAIAQTGGLTAQQVVFLPGPVRVATQVAAIGGAASGSVLTVTGTIPLVHIALDASLVGNVHPGAVESITLPDSTSVDGTILGVGAATSTTSTGQGGQAGTTTTTVAVDMVVTGADLARFNGATVVVNLVTAQAKDALSVPVKSLLALAEGGFALERVRGGVHQLVKVTPGTFAGGFVQIAGDVRVGDSVVSP